MRPAVQPPPPPGDPSDDEYTIDEGLELDPDATAAQEAQKEVLRREFIRLAKEEATAAGAAFNADDSATLSQAGFTRLLLSHMQSAGGTASDADRVGMEAELVGMWAELPKARSSAGGEGVTFPSLLGALAGGGGVAPPSAEVSPAGSRRQSLSQGGGAIAGADADGASAWSAHRKSASGPSGANAGGLRMMFAPVRRPSLKSAQSVAGSRQKRYSDSGRAGISPSSTNSATGERPRSNTLFQSVANGRTSPEPPSPPPFPAAAVAAVSAKGGPNGTSPIAAGSVAFRINRAVSSYASSTPGDRFEPAPPAGAPASGALELNDPDWQDLGWLVQAHPAAFTVSISGSPRGSVSAGVGSPPASPPHALPAHIHPSAAPATTLVSSSAMQICLQHYLSRWLSAHELGVIATLWRFVRGLPVPSTPGGKAAAGSTLGGASNSQAELLSYEVLQRVVRALFETIKQNPQAKHVDPLPAFAQAMGLLPPPSATRHGALAQPTIEEVLERIQLWSSIPLPPSVSPAALLKSFGPDALHHPSLLSLLGEIREYQQKLNRAEKEYSMLSTNIANLDSSHNDLTMQIPFLQQQMETIKQERDALKGEMNSYKELETTNKNLKITYEKLQKKMQQLQEDHSSLQNELQLSKELSLSTDAELSSVTASHAKLKEKVGGLEKDLAASREALSRKGASDGAQISALQDQLRAKEAQYHDLLEKSQIFYRRLVAVGETAGLEGIDGIGDDAKLVGSLAITRGKKRDGASVHLRDELNESLGSELDNSARDEALSKVTAQAAELDALKRQMANFQTNLQAKDREIQRLQGEIDNLHIQAAQRPTTSPTTPLEIGDSSDGDNSKKNQNCCHPLTEKCVIQ